MKTHCLPSISARTTLAVLLCLFGIALLCAIPFFGTRAQSPSNVIPFSGSFDNTHAYPCNSTPSGFVVPPGQARIVVNVDATIPTNDLAVTLYQTTGAPLALGAAGNVAVKFAGQEVEATVSL